MPPFGPIKRKKLIAYLRKVGFEGPEPAGPHQVMVKGSLTISIPNPHRQKDIGLSLLKKILDQAGISREEWEKL